MLMQEFDDWAQENENRYEILSKNPDKQKYTLFSIFYQNHTFGDNFFQICAQLAFEIYLLQVCVEGLIEDIEGLEK